MTPREARERLREALEAAGMRRIGWRADLRMSRGFVAQTFGIGRRVGVVQASVELRPLLDGSDSIEIDAVSRTSRRRAGSHLSGRRLGQSAS